MDIVPSNKNTKPNALEKTVEIMGNPVFRELFDTYFNNLTDIQSILLFMKHMNILRKCIKKLKE